MNMNTLNQIISSVIVATGSLPLIRLSVIILSESIDPKILFLRQSFALDYFT